LIANHALDQDDLDLFQVVQDVLALGSEARMNTPGQAGGNWTWRYRPEMLAVDLAERLRAISATYGRVKKPTKQEPEEEAEEAVDAPASETAQGERG